MAARVRLLLPVAAAAAAGTAGGVALTQAEPPLPLAALGLPRGGLAGADGGTLQGLDPSKGLEVRAARARPALADVSWVRDLAAGAGAKAVFTADSMCCTPTYANHLARPSRGLCLHASDVKLLTLLFRHTGPRAPQPCVCKKLWHYWSLPKYTRCAVYASY